MSVIASILLIMSTTSFSLGIRFIKGPGFYAGDTDGSFLRDFQIIGDNVYLLTTEGSSHRNFQTFFKLANFNIVRPLAGSRAMKNSPN